MSRPDYTPDNGSGKIGCGIAVILATVVGLPVLILDWFRNSRCDAAIQTCPHHMPLWITALVIIAICATIGLLITLFIKIVMARMN